VWKGGVDKDRKLSWMHWPNTSLDDMSSKIDTLWNIYVLDALHTKPNLAQYHSPMSITAAGVEEIPEDIRLSLNLFASVVMNIRTSRHQDGMS